MHLGALSLRPTVFLDAIGLSRSATTADSISTSFGRIPLTETEAESTASVRHSRFMLRSELPAGRLKLTTWLESDFMNFTPNQRPFRWRQYWGEARIGRWEILGGQAWSILRPNRVGITSDKDTMNTDAIEPAYHIGLLGFRARQIRISRSFGTYKAVVAWEGNGNLLTKVVRDSNRQHYEAGAFGGRFGGRGVNVAAVYSATPRLHLITQNYYSRHAVYQAIGGAPAGADGISTIEGAEMQLTKNLEAYTYGGLVYATHLKDSGNRLMREISFGVNRKIPLPAQHAVVLLSLQYSRMDRAIWSGQSGTMDYLMYRFRYTFN